MKYILLLLLFLSSLFSNEYIVNDNSFTKKESSVFGTNSVGKAEVMSEIDNEIKKEEKKTKPQNLYLNYKYFPEKIFKNQRFEIVIKAIITTNYYDRIETNFINSKNMDVINANSEWIKNEDKTFENRFYFKAYDKNFILPTFQVALFKNDILIETQNLKPKKTMFSEIGTNVDNFSSVIAKNLIINAHKTKQYNNEELITIFDMNGIESNLEDFYIKGVKEQGISKIEDTYPEQNLLYYLVLPVHTKKIDFSYYNSFEKRFITVKVPIILENELVSTQTDLNPNKSNLLLYKKIAFATAVVIFILIFIIKRRKIFLILGLISLIFLLIYVMPNQTSVLKKDSYIYILPTKKSTIFQKTNKDYMVEVSIERGEFIKIIFNQDNKSMIGWVKKDDLVKN